MEHLACPRFHWTAQASGFGIPHYAAVREAEVKGAYRFGPFEAVIGARGFHFKTSPKREEYPSATLLGVYAGVRWVAR